MRNLKFVLLVITAGLAFSSCLNKDSVETVQVSKDWQAAFQQKLPLLGHRNWILIVDKAFPEQTATGILTINTGEQLSDVLQYVKDNLAETAHVKPIIYRDAELDYLNDSLSAGIEVAKKKINSVLQGEKVSTILHEDIFNKIDEASELFSILVLKTEEIHPYTSIFLELDCAYWNKDKEFGLRRNMIK